MSSAFAVNSLRARTTWSREIGALDSPRRQYVVDIGGVLRKRCSPVQYLALLELADDDYGGQSTFSGDCMDPTSAHSCRWPGKRFGEEPATSLRVGVVLDFLGMTAAAVVVVECLDDDFCGHVSQDYVSNFVQQGPQDPVEALSAT